MTTLTMASDLAYLRQECVGNAAVCDRIDRTARLARPDARCLAEIGTLGQLGVYRTLALMLKVEYQAAFIIDAATCLDATTAARRDWQPWQDVARWSSLLASLPDAPDALACEVLVREQIELGCVHSGAAQVAVLAARYEEGRALLAQASAADQTAFLFAKRAWLNHAQLLAVLVDRHLRLIDDIKEARFRFLALYPDYPVMVEAGQRLALWRFRLALDDASLTAEEIRLVLSHRGDAACTIQPQLEPALLAVLGDEIGTLRDDVATMRFVVTLAQADRLVPADAAQIALAERLRKQLAQRTHPDKLTQHPRFAAITPADVRRLREIFQSTTNTRDGQVHLDRRSLTVFIAQLQRYAREVDRILERVALSDPIFPATGQSFEQWSDAVHFATDGAEHSLHALRDTIAQLQLDPRYRREQRLTELDAPDRAAEAARMREQTREWCEEARVIEQQMLERAKGQALAERRQLGLE